MAGGIFLNYRRSDDPGFALALFQRLELAFPGHQIFMDVEGGIAAGADYVAVLNDQVAGCDVLLVLIGPGWIDARDEVGRRRLDNPDDFVRVEIAAALRTGKRVIPVLVNKAEMPRAEALPDDLKPLSRRNAVRLTQERFRADAEGLSSSIKAALAETETARAATAAERSAALERETAEAARKAEAERLAMARAGAGLSSVEIAKLEELANWDYIKDMTDPQEFRDHLARFPSGVVERPARAKLEVVTWAGLDKSNSLSGVKAFLTEFPSGPNAAAARRWLDVLEKAAAKSREAADAARAEADAWTMASIGDAAAAEAFLRTYPRSIHAVAAKARLKDLRRKPAPTEAEAKQNKEAILGIAMLGFFTYQAWKAYPIVLEFFKKQFGL